MFAVLLVSALASLLATAPVTLSAAANDAASAAVSDFAPTGEAAVERGLGEPHERAVDAVSSVSPAERAVNAEPYDLDFSYHDYEQLTAFLRRTSTRFPHLTALYSIGKSVQGRDLWVLVVSSSPYEHMIGKPDVKYVANMHGNEAVGRELMLHLIHYLVTSYSSGDTYVRWLLDNSRVHILPSMNPDGYEVARQGHCDGGQGRYNARGFDLNRNFPDYFKQNNKRGQPETDAVKEWVSKIQFVLSGGLHGGALVASYPFDNTPNSMFQSHASAPSLTPDDDVFRHLALTYARNHPVMARGAACRSGVPAFPQGITNGAAWYPLTGGMQDFNYVWHGCMEVTLELSCCKFPPAADLPKFWEENRLALVRFLGEAQRGVRGFVTDSAGTAVARAALKVKGRDVGFQTTKYGEFWRILLPGLYKLEVYADGFAPAEVDFAVVEQHPTLLNVTLQPAQVGAAGVAVAAENATEAAPAAGPGIGLGTKARGRSRPRPPPPWFAVFAGAGEAPGLGGAPGTGPGALPWAAGGGERGEREPYTFESAAAAASRDKSVVRSGTPPPGGGGTPGAGRGGGPRPLAPLLLAMAAWVLPI